MRGDEGAGLLELLIGMLLLSMVAGAVVSVALASVRVERFAGDLSGEVESARVALDRLRKDVRSTNDVRPGSGPRALALFLNTDQDAVIDPGELVTYTLAATPDGLAELRRQVGGQAGYTVVARRLVNQDIFTYAPTGETVTITLSAAGGGRSTRDESTTLSTTVRVRNV